MEAVLNHTELKIDKSTWKKVKFGDVVAEPKETCKDLLEEGIEHVVGLEHIDTGDIHLRKSATTEESTTFTKKFRKGDVLFGRRRAYLKKAAQAEFDGICSGDITVFRTKKELLPELLPFIVNNDAFFDYAVKHSAGGLSPRVKFQDLANYEFLLPPKAEQARLAELLWAMDEVIQKEKEHKFWLVTLKKALVKEKCLNIRGEKKNLEDIIDYLEAGISVNSEEGNLEAEDYGILKTSSVSEGIFIPTEVKKVKKSEVNRLKAPVRQNSIIISRMNTAELVGANGYVDRNYDNLFLPDRLWQTHISSEAVNVKFLWYVLSSPTFRSRISDLCTGTSNSMKNISQKSFLGLEVILPSRLKQDLVVSEINTVQYSINKSESKIAASQALQKSLINQLF